MKTALPSGVTLRVVFLARYAELVGTAATEVSLPAPARVSDVLAAIRQRFPGAAALPERPLCALNYVQVDLSAAVAQGDELALLPPVAGG